MTTANWLTGPPAAMLLTFLLGVFLREIVERLKKRKNEQHREKPTERRREVMRFDSRPGQGTAGWTIAAALNGVGCLGRSAYLEPVFVLCARDRAASMTVRDWADLAEKLGAKPAKVREARELADRMEEWRTSHGGGKIPD